MIQKNKLIVALDLPDPAAARRMVETLGDTATFYKIGLELAIAGGLPLVSVLSKQGYKVFLDLKLHDIGNTVEKATLRAIDLGATFFTVHAYRQTMQAAQRAAQNSPMQILAVTVLTSWDEEELQTSGITQTIPDTVIRKASLASQCGIKGIVASAQEASMIRSRLGNSLTLVTPGIRLKSDLSGDQSRITTPSEALSSGADYIVVGRPILNDPNPRQAAQRIIEEISSLS